MSFGVTPTGFVRKTLQDVLASLRAAQAAAPELGPNLDTSDLSPTGQLNGTFASELAEVWEVLEDVFASNDPEAATDYALTVLASLTGTARRGATASQVAVTLNLDAGALVPAGSLIAVDGRPDIQCALDEDVENTGGSAANFSSTATCTQTGPVAINSGTLTVIVNAVSGWNSVTNPADAEQGRTADSDVTLRQRRIDQLALRGGSTVRAITADLLDSETHPELDGIEDVIVLENTSDVVNGEGLLPHSFEAIIDDGAVPTVDNDDVAQAIYATKPAGIIAGGGVFGTADTDAGPLPIFFSRATRKNVYVEIGLMTTAEYPADGDDQVIAAILAYADQLGVGDDVIALRVRAAAFSVPGVADVPTFAIGFAISPTLDDNLSIATRERAAFDSSRIAVS